MAKAKTGRPQKEVNEVELSKLASMGCTMKEMASFFECSVDTLERRFADVIDAGREKGKSSVRRMLWLQGEKGNSVALKYLIHNVLKEKLEDPHAPVVVQDGSPEHLRLIAGYVGEKPA